MPTNRIDLPAGAVELLVLRSLSRRPSHGYGLIQTIRDHSEEALSLEEGSLYPALHRMERHGWITSEWGVSENGRRAKYYSLSQAGKNRLKSARRTWEKMTRAVGLVLGTHGAGA